MISFRGFSLLGLTLDWGLLMCSRVLFDLEHIAQAGGFSIKPKTVLRYDIRFG